MGAQCPQSLFMTIKITQIDFEDAKYSRYYGNWTDRSDYTDKHILHTYGIADYDFLRTTDKLLPLVFGLQEHLDGFDKNRHNDILDNLNYNAQIHNVRYTVYYHNILLTDVTDHYKNLDIRLWFEEQYRVIFTQFDGYITTNSDRNFDNFACSFNRSGHVSRQLLTSAMHKFKWFDTNYSSKLFTYSIDNIDGHIQQYVTGSDERLYRKFIIDNNAEDFYNSISGFSEETRIFEHQPYDQINNINLLAEKITNSFVQIVSETLGTSYNPYVTEKVLFPIICKTLWVGYNQPNYHQYFEKFYGFRKYDKIFDYTFDQIDNPIIRLVTLMTMLSKFEKLSKADLHDLYLLENDTIEFNYDHYYSGDYMKRLTQQYNMLQYIK
jgi:hypothetical protein